MARSLSQIIPRSCTAAIETISTEVRACQQIDLEKAILPYTIFRSLQSTNHPRAGAVEDLFCC